MNPTLRILYSLAFLSALTACEKNNHPEEEVKSDHRKTNEWIDETLRNYYLWYEEIPSEASLNYEADPSDFFFSLLSDKDGKTISGKHYYFSSISKSSATKAQLTTDGSSTYGIDYMPYRVDGDQGEIYFLRVNYVLPGSPAAEAGIQRGDWVIELDDAYIREAYSLDEGAAAQATLARLNAGGTLTVKTKVDLPAARAVEDSPFLLDTVYTRNSKKIAYLVYTHFSSGPESYKDEAYNKQMKEIFTGFKNQGATECILDLRYNGGGQVKCAQLLTSLLAPADALNDVFCIEQYNAKQNPRQGIVRLLSPGEVSDGNLNLRRLYVLVSERSASASELVINSLRPYMGSSQVILIGTRTLGKNVGSFVYEDHGYEINPICFHVFNKTNQADYANGFAPDIPYDEYDEMDKDFLPLGDQEESLLKQALARIDGSAVSFSVKSDSPHRPSRQRHPLGTPVPRPSKYRLIDLPAPSQQISPAN